MQLHGLFFFPGINSVIEFRRIRWVGLIACAGEKRHVKGCGWENLKERDHFENLG